MNVPPVPAPSFNLPGNAVQAANAIREGVLSEVRKAVVGQDEALELMLCGLIAGGHVLLEGVPGVAKTLMAKALARSVSSDFKRIQFTPDLMPADILGTSIFDLKTQSFVLVRRRLETDALQLVSLGKDLSFRMTDHVSEYAFRGYSFKGDTWQQQNIKPRQDVLLRQEGVPELIKPTE